MAVLIDIEDSDFGAMCSECSAVFELQYKRANGVELSYCPFCGAELEDETNDFGGELPPREVRK